MAIRKFIEQAIISTFPELTLTNKKLPRGANAEVFLLSSPQSENLLLKAIDKKKKKERDLEGTEESALRRVNSKFVVPLLDAREDNRYKFLLFPFIEGHDLHELIKERQGTKQPFSNKEILTFAKQMAYAVIDMNKAGVIHQDIKPRNIRVNTDGDYLLLDLGIARFKETGRRGISRGAYGYSSPEQLYGVIEIPGKPHITFSSDHWAIGTIMYLMATLKHPFNFDANLTMCSPVKDPKHINPHLDRNISNIILTLLNKHAIDRYITPRVFLDALNGTPPVPREAFGGKIILNSYKRTPISREFIQKYKDKVDKEHHVPHGIVLPSQNITRNNKPLITLKAQGYHLFVDPETYLEMVNKSTSTLNRYLGQRNKKRLISSTLEKQLNAGADYLISPYFFIDNVDGNALPLTTFLYEESFEYLNKQNLKIPLFGGLFMSRTILVNEKSRKKVLDDVSATTDELAGIYLIAETTEIGSMPVKDRDLLKALAEIVMTLSKKLPIVLGYGDIFALGLIPFGLSGIVSHPSPSARKMNMPQLMKKEEGKKKKGKKSFGRTPPQFYAPNLLNFVRVTGELDKLLKSEEYDDVLMCNCPFCHNSLLHEAKRDPDILIKWKDEDRYNHYIYNLTKDANILKKLSPLEGKKRFLSKIRTAKSFYKRMRADSIALNPHSEGDFLEAWEESFS